MGILTQFIKVSVFLKGSLKYTKIYIVCGFLSTKIDFMLKVNVKRLVLSVFY